MTETSVDIEYKNVTFTVRGEWISHHRATQLEPSEGGYLDDIKIEIKGEDVTEFIESMDRQTWQLLCDKADEEISGTL